MAGFEETLVNLPGKQEVETLPQVADREYDRRGVLLPRRARVGGIITPQ